MIEINKRKIGKNRPPFIIAELSANHNQSLKRALKLVEKAKEANVDAVKLQTYTPDSITLNKKNNHFRIVDNSPWKGQYFYDLYKQAYMPWEWHKTIFDKCKELDLVYFSSVYDPKAVNFLERFDVPCYKIASFENTDPFILKSVAETKKTVIMSTGLASLDDIKKSVEILNKFGCDKIILLKCTSAYPANIEDANLFTITDMKKQFNYEIGLSDHTLGVGVAIASIALGACVIEKHFTLSRKTKGIDSVFSMEPDEMKLLVQECHNAHRALGKVYYGHTEREKKSLRYTRSLFAKNNLKKGDIISYDNIVSLRPKIGISSKDCEKIIGKKIIKNVEFGTSITWDLLEK